MSTIKEVLERYHAKVTFPVTPAKIRAAGYDVEEYLDDLIEEIRAADDSQDPDIHRRVNAIQRIWSGRELT